MDSSVLSHPVRIPSRLAAPRSFMYLIGYSTETRLHDSAKTTKHPTLLTPLHTIWRARGQQRLPARCLYFTYQQLMSSAAPGNRYSFLITEQWVLSFFLKYTVQGQVWGGLGAPKTLNLMSTTYFTHFSQFISVVFHFGHLSKFLFKRRNFCGRGVSSLKNQCWRED